MKSKQASKSSKKSPCKKKKVLKKSQRSEDDKKGWKGKKKSITAENRRVECINEFRSQKVVEYNTQAQELRDQMALELLEPKSTQISFNDKYNQFTFLKQGKRQGSRQLRNMVGSETERFERKSSLKGSKLVQSYERTMRKFNIFADTDYSEQGTVDFGSISDKSNKLTSPEKPIQGPKSD